MSRKRKAPAREPAQMSLHELVHAFGTCVSQHRSELRTLIEGDPCIESNLRSLFTNPPYDDSNSTLDSPLMTTQCKKDRQGPRDNSGVAAKSSIRTGPRYKQIVETKTQTLIDNFSSTKNLQKISKGLIDLRCHVAALQSSETRHTAENPSVQRIIDHISYMRVQFHDLNDDAPLRSFRERYERSLIGELYFEYKSKPDRPRGSLGVLFATAVLPNARTARLEHEGLRKAWKGQQRINPFWSDLKQTFGCGVLLLIPDELSDESARQMGPKAIEMLQEKIYAKYPNLKNDLASLSAMLTSMVESSPRSNSRLLIESLNQDEIPNKSFAELFSLNSEAGSSVGHATRAGRTRRRALPDIR